MGEPTIGGVEEEEEVFDAETPARALKDAMKGLGTNEGEIIKIVATHNNRQRQLVKEQYTTAYGQELEEDLKGELGGCFEDLVLALFTKPRVYDARQVNAAIKGGGTDEEALIEILATRSNDEIEEVKQLYKEEFESDMIDDIRGDTGGDFERLMASLANANRDETDDVDDDLAQTDADTLIESGEAQWGTDESEFNRILCSRNVRQLRATFDAYSDKAGKDVTEVIDAEMTGTLQKGFLAIVKVARDPCEFFADRLQRALKGAGTDDSDLKRILVSRSEIDLATITSRFESKYERPLEEAIRGDCRGDYRILLLALIGVVPEDA